jgi:hypothetical protein
MSGRVAGVGPKGSLGEFTTAPDTSVSLRRAMIQIDQATVAVFDHLLFA